MIKHFSYSEMPLCMGLPYTIKKNRENKKINKNVYKQPKKRYYRVLKLEPTTKKVLDGFSENS